MYHGAAGKERQTVAKMKDLATRMAEQSPEWELENDPDYLAWLDNLERMARQDEERERKLYAEYAARPLTAEEVEANERAEALYDQTKYAY